MAAGDAPAWVIEPSTTAKRTFNPIRAIVDTIKMPKDHAKSLIPLSLGDPTVFGNLLAPEPMIAAIERNVRSFKHNGYAPSAGTVDARTAIAKRFGSEAAPLDPSDVMIASGCSGALDLAIGVLVGEGENLLIPNPGFTLYGTLATSKGADVKTYSLDPERGWEVDLASLEAAIDDKTRAIVVNNPSNPCGSVYSEEHLRAILAVAEKHRIPVIADEIYGNMTFKGCPFHPLASLTTTVPILAVGGIAKEFLVPGWRVGWVLVHDRNGAFSEIKPGLLRMTQLIIGANTLIQSALPAVLTPESDEDKAAMVQFRTGVMDTLEANAELVFERMQAAKGVTPIRPQGAMYVMIRIDLEGLDDSISDDRDFTQLLLTEENVFMLPGACFGMPNFARIVFSAPAEVLADACDRIASFCERHASPAR